LELGFPQVSLIYTLPQADCKISFSNKSITSEFENKWKLA
jgi:hypothetical protein